MLFKEYEFVTNFKKNQFLKRFVEFLENYVNNFKWMTLKQSNVFTFQKTLLNYSF